MLGWILRVRDNGEKNTKLNQNESIVVASQKETPPFMLLLRKVERALKARIR